MPKYLRYIELDLCGEIRENTAWRDIFLAIPQVVPLYEYELDKASSNGVSKLVLEITTEKTQHLQKKQLINVLVVSYYFNMDDYSRYDTWNQKKHLLDAILACLLKFADEYGWNREQCQLAYDRILARNIQFEQYIGRVVQNKINRFKAQCYFSFEEKITLHLDVWQDRDLENKKRLLVTQMQGGWYLFGHVFGRLFWKDTEIVVLEWRNKRGCWEINITDETVNFKHHKFNEEDNNAQGLYQLACLYLNGDFFLPDYEKAISLLEKSAALGYKHAKKKLEWVMNQVERRTFY